MLPSLVRRKMIQPRHCHVVVQGQIMIEQHDVNQEHYERHGINIAVLDHCGISNPLRLFDMLEQIYRLM